MLKMTAHKAYKIKLEKNLTDEEYKQLLIDNGILVPRTADSNAVGNSDLLVMQREIKFRCWDNLQGGKFEYWDAKTNKYDGVFWLMIRNISFENPQQFTGLKDKNGKEIYEGDYLVDRYEADRGENIEGDIESLLPVVWNAETLQWCIDVSFAKDGSCLEPILGFFSETTLETKGNIFEKD